jgi:hypothetical protein
MIRILVLMAAFCQMMACGVDDKEFTKEGVGWQVDSPSCKSIRSNYVRVTDEMRISRNISPPVRNFIADTLRSVYDESSVASCFTEQELIDLYLFERGVKLNDLENEVAIWGEWCNGEWVLERTKSLSDPIRSSEDASVRVNIGDPPIDQVRKIRAYVRANCDGYKKSRVDPGAFSSAVGLARAIDNFEQRQLVVSDIVLAFYKTHYTKGSINEFAASAFIVQNLLEDFVDPDQFARELIESGAPPSIELYLAWGVKIVDMHDELADLVQNSDDTAKTQGDLIKLGYPAQLVHTIVWQKYIDTHQYQLAAQLAHSHLGQPWIRHTENELMAAAKESGKFILSVDPAGSRTYSYDFNDW